jgi:hypothetical protein
MPWNQITELFDHASTATSRGKLIHQLAHKDSTGWLGMSDSNSGVRARTMYLRNRDNPRRLGQNAPAQTIRI